jgi:hypothetical protein
VSIETLRLRLPRLARDVGASLALGVAAAWSVFALGGAFDIFAVPYQRFVLGVVSVPLALAAVLVFGRAPPSLPLRLAAAWSGIVAGGVILGLMIDRQPLLALALPAALASAFLLRRYPAAGVVALFALTGSWGTLTAYTELKVGAIVDLILAGLWFGVIWTYLLKGRKRPLRVWPGVAAAALYLVVTALQIFTAGGIWGGVSSFRTSAWYMTAFLLIGYAGWQPKTYKRIAYGVVAVAALVGAYATLRWVIGPTPTERSLALQQPVNFVDGELRLFGSFWSGHQLGAWCSVALPFCLACALAFRGRWRAIAVGACLVLTIGLLGSEARTAMVAVVFGLATAFVLYQSARAFRGLHLGATAAALIAAVAVGLVVFSWTAGTSERDTERYTVVLTPSRDPAFRERLLRWRDAFEEIDRHPFGAGLGTASPKSVDNSYLHIALDQGLLIMALFIAAMLLLLVGLARLAILTLDRHKAGLSIGACGALAAYLVLLTSGGYIEGLIAIAAWVIVGLGVAQFAWLERDGGVTSRATPARRRRALPDEPTAVPTGRA